MAIDYREYVSARMDGFRRTAFLLCGDWHLADDLVSDALLKLLRHWRRVSEMEDPDAYVRRMLLRCLLDERRRPWRREESWDQLPEQRVDSLDASITERAAMLSALSGLTPRQRAVIVLRFFCDLSVEQAAVELDCSTGTVKSQTSKALQAMRSTMSNEGQEARRG